MSNVDINVDGRTDGRTDERTDGRTDGRTENRTPISHPATSRCDKNHQIHFYNVISDIRITIKSTINIKFTYRILSNYCTVGLGFFKIIGKTF